MNNYYSEKQDKLILKLKIKPNSQTDKFVKILNDELVININAQPEKGKANKKLIVFLSKSLKIKKQQIVIISGATSQHKTIQIPKISLDIIKKKIKM